MASYAAPLKDMRFVLDHVAGFDRVTRLPGGDAATPDLVDAVLEEAAKLAASVLAPLNTVGDREPPRLVDGAVRMPPGFADAHRHLVDGGWTSIPFDPAYGGQGLPWTVSMMVMEIWQSAALAYSLCPMLTQGAIEALAAHGSPDLKAAFLPPMIAGTWTGTMNLTEPQAGSDLSQVRCRAEPAGDGTHRIIGQKIFITFGEHDLAENIVHLVLARLPGAPAGTRGISLFAVPRRLVNPDGSPGPNNDVRCAGIEHKLGIHGSPTCVMAFGDRGGAVGYLVGEPNRGLECMFTMMNNARLSVGLQGVAIAERAYQQARDYARERVQGKDLADPAGPAVPIIRHPDVRRMLLDMRAGTEAGRALAAHALVHLDVALRSPDRAEASAAQARVDLLTPVVKAWCTDMGVEAASLGVQVHGGMGYIEETGAAQHLRDARIAPIYEGTNGVQANDLLFRKVARDGGAAALALCAEMAETATRLEASGTEDLAAMAAVLGPAVSLLEDATRRLAGQARSAPAEAAAGAVPYLRLFGAVVAGWLMATGAAAASRLEAEPDADRAFLQAKRLTARHFLDHAVTAAPGLHAAATTGRAATVAWPEDWF